MFCQAVNGVIYKDPVWITPHGIVQIVDNEMVYTFDAPDNPILPFRCRVIKAEPGRFVLYPKSTPRIPDGYGAIVSVCASSKFLAFKNFPKDLTGADVFLYGYKAPRHRVVRRALRQVGTLRSVNRLRKW